MNKDKSINGLLQELFENFDEDVTDSGRFELDTVIEVLSNDAETSIREAIFNEFPDLESHIEEDLVGACWVETIDPIGLIKLALAYPSNKGESELISKLRDQTAYLVLSTVVKDYIHETTTQF